MAEILIRIVDKALSGDPYIDRHRTGRGDVITIQEDGFGWRPEELNLSQWRVLKIPGVPVNFFSQLTDSDPGYLDKEAEKINRVLRRRTHKLNFMGLIDLLNTPQKITDIKNDPIKAREYLSALIEARPILVDSSVSS